MAHRLARAPSSPVANLSNTLSRKTSSSSPKHRQSGSLARTLRPTYIELPSPPTQYDFIPTGMNARLVGLGIGLPYSPGQNTALSIHHAIKSPPPIDQAQYYRPLHFTLLHGSCNMPLDADNIASARAKQSYMKGPRIRPLPSPSICSPITPLPPPLTTFEARLRQLGLDLSPTPTPPPVIKQRVRFATGRRVLWRKSPPGEQTYFRSTST